MKHFLAASALTLVSLMAADAATVSPADIIPRPTEVTVAKGTFAIPADGFAYTLKGTRSANLDAFIATLPDRFHAAAKASRADLAIEVGKAADTDESYSMEIAPKRITIKAPSAAGAFYGLQSLLQMTDHADATELQCARLTDKPRFAYRGLHFDVSRHFRSIDFLKKQLDAMALMKLNRMHLHFTDGAGWRMQVDKYPRLTEFAAWRPQAVWQDWVDNGAKYCESTDDRAAGGFYTKEQLRDLVKYAAERGITVIPELEVPGHSIEVTSAYPEMSCSGKPYTDQDLCIGKEATFKFIEDVIDEIIEVFPSHYIHIGGDEAAKDGWRKCPDCQARMKAEGLKDVDELQSYAIHRVEQYVNSKGRSIIGWDEILEGGLAPNATVMSWRGTEGGITALKSGHDVVMTPGEFCYIDYTQDAAFKEPVSIGGYTPLSKVYSYEPLEPGLTDTDASHLLGLQANLWSEYIPTDRHAEYMYYPRAFAIAEIGWSTPEKDYPDFHRRALKLNARLDSLGYNTFDLANEYGERRESLTPVANAAKGAKVSYVTRYHSKYPAAGDATLVDGLRGGWTYGDKRWQGFLGDFEAVIDLGEVRDIHSVDATFMHAPGAWVHLPSSVTVSLSTDGTDFTETQTRWSDVDPMYPKIMMKDFVTSHNAKARYVKVCAKGHDRPGAWLFVDEIIVD